MSEKMDHIQFVSSLPTEEKLRLTTLSNTKGLAHLAGHLGLIVILGGLIATGVPGWPLLLVPQGIVLIFLFTLEHECTHRTPFATPALNDVVGRACGFVLLLPFEWFRYFHLAHHRWTNLPGKDPELDGAQPETWRQWLWHVSGLPYWGGMAKVHANWPWAGERRPIFPHPPCPAFGPRRDFCWPVTCWWRPVC